MAPAPRERRRRKKHGAAHQPAASTGVPLTAKARPQPPKAQPARAKPPAGSDPLEPTLPARLRHLADEHRLVKITVQPGDRVRARVQAVLKHLLGREQLPQGQKQPQTQHQQDQERPLLLALAAAPRAANKLLTVVHIAARTHSGAGHALCQYTRLHQRCVVKKVEGVDRAGDGADVDDDGADDGEEPAFEVGPLRPTYRDEPVLVVYLSLQPVPQLAELYSEQRCSPLASHS